MNRTQWCTAALAAGWMGLALAQGAGAGAGAGAGGGAGAGKDTSSSAGTKPSPKEDMGQTGSQAAGAAAGAMGAADTAATMAKLHAGHQAEVAAGEWMQSHATSPRVKEFATRMVDDHGAMDRDVEKYAQKHQLALTGADVASEQAKHREQLDALKALSGAEADRHYMQMMVDDHTKDVSEVKTAAGEARHGKDQEYARLLDRTEKKMESHLHAAQRISHDLSSRQARHPAENQ